MHRSAVSTVSNRAQRVPKMISAGVTPEISIRPRCPRTL